MADIRVDIDQLRTELAELRGLRDDMLDAEKKASAGVKKAGDHCNLGWQLSTSLASVDKRSIELMEQGIGALQLSILTYQTVDSALAAQNSNLKAGNIPVTGTIAGNVINVGQKIASVVSDSNKSVDTVDNSVNSGTANDVVNESIVDIPNTDTNSSPNRELLEGYVGIPQDKGGHCTYISTAMMIQREKILNHQDSNLTWQDVQRAMGNSWTAKEDCVVNGINYNLVKCSEFNGNGVTNLIGTDRRSGLINLLNENPEGVVIHCNYTAVKANGKSEIREHAILLTGYEDGHFKCIDPCSVAYEKKPNEINLEDSWLFEGSSTAHGNHKFDSVDALLSSIKTVMYSE